MLATSLKRFEINWSSDTTPSVTYHGPNVTPSSTGQPPGARADKHPGEPEEPTDADPCCDT